MNLLKSCYLTLREVSVSGIFLVRISGIRYEYGDLQGTFPYSVRLQENKDQTNSKHHHFLRCIIIRWVIPT